jgi:hypothetical protein
MDPSLAASPQSTWGASGSAFRVLLEEDSIVLESREVLVGQYLPVQELFWEEIRAVYVWQRPNWTNLVVYVCLIAIFWCVFGVAALAAGADAWTQLVLALAAVVFAAAAVINAVWLHPQRWLKLGGGGREIEMQIESPAVLTLLEVRLNVSLAQPSAARSRRP